MSSVFKRARDRKRPGSSWYIAFSDQNGKRRTMKGCSDKAATEAMARKLESEADLRRPGIIDPRTDAYTAHEARPLVDHLADYHAYLIAKGATVDHAELVKARCARIIDLARFKRPSDLSPSRFLTALKAVRDSGAALRTVHHYVRQFKAFSRWLWRDGRIREDTLAHVAPPNPDPDRRHERRALAPEELARMIRAAESGPVLWKLSGPDRAALYLVALGTGFRRNELRSLKPEAFALDGDSPTITVAAAYSKRRRDDVQPIRPDLADALRPWLATRTPGQPVFGKLTKHTAAMIRADLERAGIPYRDDSGRVADFHALRHSSTAAGS
jgi:integrase